MTWASKKQLQGFTIVELIIVVAVLAILATVVIVAFNGTRESSERAAAASELSDAIVQLGLYKLANQEQLPPNLDAFFPNRNMNKTWSYRLQPYFGEYCISVGETGRQYSVNNTGVQNIQQGSCDSIGGAMGPPLAYNTTPGTVVSFPAVTGDPDLTLYVVVDIFNMASNFTGLAGISPGNTTQRMQLDTNGTDSNVLRYRIDTSVSSNLTAGQSGVRTPGRHIGWVQISNGKTTRSFAYDRASAFGSTSLPASGPWSVTGLQMFNSSTSQAPIAAVLYNAAHTQEQRARVIAWLASQHNVPLSTLSP